MAKYKITRKNQQLFIRGRLEFGEKINETEYQLLSSNLIRGIMKPTVVGRRKITYSGPNGISLQDMLSLGVTLNDFFLIMAQIVDITKFVSSSRDCDIRNLVMDTKYVFVNEMTKNVSMIYQPLQKAKLYYEVFPFLYDITSSVKFFDGEDYDKAQAFAHSLRVMQYYSPVEMEKTIGRLQPGIYKKFRRMKTTSFTEFHVSDDLKEEPNHSPAAKDEERTSLLEEDETALLEEDEEGTALLEEDEEGTALLEEEEEGTVLLKEIQKKPYLIRLLTYQRVDINKSVFLIGKGSGQVDFFIGNNNTISRVHAEIIKEHGSCFIRDRGSTNGTFVDGVRIPENQKYPLEEGSRFLLSNEEFEFHED